MVGKNVDLATYQQSRDRLPDRNVEGHSCGLSYAIRGAQLEMGNFGLQVIEQSFLSEKGPFRPARRARCKDDIGELVGRARTRHELLSIGGGNIRTIAVNAAFLAASAQSPITTLHVMRAAARDFTFAGHAVREGDPVIVATSVSHFLPSLWQRPSEFDVGRFEEGRSEHRKPGAYAPYGLGPHTCLGAGLAEVQLVLLVASLLHEVELRLDPPGYVLRTVMAPGPTPDARFGMAVVRRRA